MPAFPLDAFLASLPWVALGLVALLAVTFAVAVRQSRHSVIDTVWGLGFVVAAAVSWLLSAGHGDGGRRLLLLALVAVWGIRLAVHIGVRARGGHEDPRYVDMLSSAPGSRNTYALRRVYLPQGIVMFFVSLTIQVGMFSTGALGWLALLGVAAVDCRLRLRNGRRLAAGAVQGGSGQTRHRPGHRALALHPAPELLRRRRRLGRAVPRRRGLLARRADHPLPRADDLDAGRQDRQAPDREGHVRPARLQGVRRIDLRLPALAAATAVP